MQNQGPGSSSSSSISYSYKVNVINPRKKSYYMVLKWHQMKQQFTSPTHLKKTLTDSFPDYIPSHSDFQVVFLDGQANAKR